MNYKFNEHNNITGYIKELLFQFNLPTLKVYKENLTLLENRSYIKDKNIVIWANNKFTKLAPFEYNRKILNFTTNLKMNSSIYDTYTHEYLGRYLRFARDYWGLNLMPLYNCFSYNQPLEFYYNIKLDNENTFKLNTGDNHYSYYLVPVVLGQEYTIAIDSPVSYEVCTLIYTGNQLLDIAKDLIKDSYKVIPGSNFNRPFIYKTIEPSNENNYWKFEKRLYLLLKLPKRINSSITVLEGNYLSCANTCGGKFMPKYIINKENISLHPSKNVTPPSRLSLLEINDGYSYPFADRLVEYLLGNVITPIDEIDENIKRVQEQVYLKQRQMFQGVYGQWDSNLKSEIYNCCQQKKVKYNEAYLYHPIQNPGEQPSTIPAEVTDLIEDKTKRSLTYYSRDKDGTRQSLIDQWTEHYNDVMSLVKIRSFDDINKDLLYFVDKDVESLIRSL